MEAKYGERDAGEIGIALTGAEAGNAQNRLAWLNRLGQMTLDDLLDIAVYLDRGGQVCGLTVGDVLFEIDWRFCGPHP
jgi:hypothetical protein